MNTNERTRLGCFGENDKLIRDVLAATSIEELDEEAEWAQKRIVQYAGNAVGLSQAKVEYWNRYKNDLAEKGEDVATERRVKAVKVHVQNVLELHRFAGKWCDGGQLVKCGDNRGLDDSYTHHYYRELLEEADKRIPSGAPEERDLLRLTQYFLFGCEKDCEGTEFKTMGGYTMSLVVEAYVKAIEQSHREEWMVVVNNNDRVAVCMGSNYWYYGPHYSYIEVSDESEVFKAMHHDDLVWHMQERERLLKELERAGKRLAEFGADSMFGDVVRWKQAVWAHIGNVIILHAMAGKECGWVELQKCKGLGNTELYSELLKEAGAKVPSWAPEAETLNDLREYFLSGNIRMSPIVMEKVIEEYFGKALMKLEGQRTLGKVEPEAHEIEMF